MSSPTSTVLQHVADCTTVVGFDGYGLPEYVGVEAFASKHYRQHFTSMFAYLVSASLNDLLANAIGLPFCISTAPSPLLDASTWMTLSALGSKYLRVV